MNNRKIKRIKNNISSPLITKFKKPVIIFKFQFFYSYIKNNK